MEKDDKNNLESMRHSCEHVLMMAMLRFYLGLKMAMGPAIDEGFYFDFDYDEKITDADFPKIEEEMNKIVKKDLPFAKKELSVKEARKLFADNPYKQEWLDEIEKRGEKATVYYTGDDFVDLCAGPHIESTGKIGSFKLLSIAGAYWRGSEKNKMLTRIYGTCFKTQKELDEHLKMLDEVKKRDHRKLGKELDLFSFHEEAPGFIFWHPKGMILREVIMNLLNDLLKKSGYEQVSTPILLSEDLWHKSGHWDNYKDKMYFTKIDNRTFAIKPMNCPGVSLIYKERSRSYRDLPLRLAEAGEVHRHEPSGTLHGLFRVRAFRQDDAHIFAREDQIEEEVKNIIQLTLKLYKLIGFPDIDIELSTRPEKSIGSDEIWEKAESILKKVLKNLNLKYKINEGDGAFYGPKIDFHIKDSLSRSWQCGTIQLDFFMPERFNLEYIDKDGQPKHPVMIHRTVIGSIQRFTGILIEHYGGAFPLWLSPIQVVIIPIADRHVEAAKAIVEFLEDEGIRAVLDDRSETMQAKIRLATLQKVPFMGIIGDKEVESSKLKVQSYEGVVSVRTREGKDLGQLKLSDFIKDLKEKIDKKV